MSKTFTTSDGVVHCDECCNGDRCDDRAHRSRENCPYCLGTGVIAQPAPAEASSSLLREPSKHAPSTCYCKPGKCMAPVIMGVQTPCIDPAKRDAKAEVSQPVCPTCLGEKSIGQSDEGTLAACPNCQPAAQPPSVQPSDNYVAWLCFNHYEDGRVTIHVCDSDTKGAFKVYRHVPAASTERDAKVKRLMEAATEAATENEKLNGIGRRLRSALAALKEEGNEVADD